MSSGYFDGIVTGDGVGIFEDLIDGFRGLHGDVIPGRLHPDDFVYFDRYLSDHQKKIIRRTRTCISTGTERKRRTNYAGDAG